MIQWKGKRHKSFTDVSNEIACAKFLQAKIGEKTESEHKSERKREAGKKWGTWI